RQYLLQQGLEQDRVEEILARLRRSPIDARRLLHGMGDVLGDILEELAFDSEVELSGARERLALAWPQLSSPAAPSKPAAPVEEPEGDLGVKALARFNAGRAAGRDLDELFANLSQDLEHDDSDVVDPGELSPAPDFPGVVSAMIEEFRWERAHSDEPLDPAESRELDYFGGFAADIGRFEDLDAATLLRFTTFWIPERGDLEPDRVRVLVSGLQAFCRWTQEAHQMPLATEFGETLARLRESLPRVMRLNHLLEAPQGEETGDLYEVLGDAQGRYDRLMDRNGGIHTALPEAGLAAALRPGDRLRGTISLEGQLTVFRCYPPESAGLLA
ncbi:MAG: hypothetical protein O2816_13660, partial [Planctomycetota bacterium]|nr:hypothetical protein [Planctomycetota bacterium]